MKEDKRRKDAENAIAALRKAADIARQQRGLSIVRSDALKVKELLEQECRVTEEMLERRATI
jgi:hypothetical protein